MKSLVLTLVFSLNLFAVATFEGTVQSVFCGEVDVTVGDGCLLILEGTVNEQFDRKYALFTDDLENTDYFMEKEGMSVSFDVSRVRLSVTDLVDMEEYLQLNQSLSDEFGTSLFIDYSMNTNLMSFEDAPYAFKEFTCASSEMTFKFKESEVQMNNGRGFFATYKNLEHVVSFIDSTPSQITYAYTSDYGISFNVTFKVGEAAGWGVFSNNGTEVELTCIK